MDRIAQTFARCRAENRAAFVAYLCAGDPNFETSLEACRSLLNNGVDILELGVPFSDPLADGLTNQLAAQRALEGGMTAAKVLELTAILRREYPDAPIIFYTYYNLVFSNGTEHYIESAKKAGVDGILTLDLPPEEGSDVMEACARFGIKTVFIVAPTTPAGRLPKIAKAATGFIYYVSREGVTGVRDSVASGIKEAVSAIKESTDLPVVVGFGIGTREHVAQVATMADGVVVGSALVNIIKQNISSSENIAHHMGEKAADLAKGLR